MWDQPSHLWLLKLITMLQHMLSFSPPQLPFICSPWISRILHLPVIILKSVEDLSLVSEQEDFPAFPYLYGFKIKCPAADPKFIYRGFQYMRKTCLFIERRSICFIPLTFSDRFITVTWAVDPKSLNSEGTWKKKVQDRRGHKSL